MVEQTKFKPALRKFLIAMMDEVMQVALARKLSSNKVTTDVFSFDRTLVPDEVFNASSLERVFTASLGNTWKSLVGIIIKSHGGFAVIDYKITGTIRAGRLRRIASLLNAQAMSQKTMEMVEPEWNKELAYVLAGRGQPIPVTVVCDVYAEDRRNRKSYAFELKAPLPNSDQSKVSKEKILKLYSMEPRQVDGAYYALPYNPYGRRADYAWSFPARWFNMKEDEVVLIGDEFWDKIGGPGTYQSFIKAVNEIGKNYRERIYREFLGIEPPADVGGTAL